MNKHCQARQYSDQKVCHKCGLVWDMNDPEPPACKQEVQSTNSGVHNAMNQLTVSTLNPKKRHLIFLNWPERYYVADVLAQANITGFAISGQVGFAEALARFEKGEFQALITSKTMVTGWHSSLTQDDVDIHFVGDFADAEKEQAFGRLSVAPSRPHSASPLQPPSNIIYDEHDFVEGIRKFNLLAGNTDDRFNVRQSAMYTGLQCEELSEKMEHLGFKDAADMLHNLGLAFKKGFYDARFTELNQHGRKLILDDDVDLAVVTVGSLLSQGADVHGAFDEVNRANLSKVFPDGTLHKDANGKVVKPDGWTPPDLTPFLWYDKTYDEAGGQQAWVNPNECQCIDPDGNRLNQCDECPR